MATQPLNRLLKLGTHYTICTTPILFTDKWFTAYKIIKYFILCLTAYKFIYKIHSSDLFFAR